MMGSRPDALRFESRRTIDSRRSFCSWGPHGFRARRAAPPGRILAVAPAPLVVADRLRPHVRERAVEEGR